MTRDEACRKASELVVDWGLKDISIKSLVFDEELGKLINRIADALMKASEMPWPRFSERHAAYYDESNHLTKDGLRMVEWDAALLWIRKWLKERMGK